MEGNIVSLTQHDYYGSYLQSYTYIAYIELLAFSVGVGGEGRREQTRSKHFWEGTRSNERIENRKRGAR